MREFWINVWNSTKKICRKVANKDMWCKVGRTCLKYLSIPSWLVVLLVIITVVSLCYIFTEITAQNVFIRKCKRIINS